MTLLIIGLILFLGTHALPFIAPAWRASLQARLGAIPYQGFASVAILAGFVLILWGYGLARTAPTALYAPPVWTRHLALLVMLPVFPLLFATYLPGRIQSWAGHPMLLAVTLWALAHLIANGWLVDLVLFGSFFIWSVAARISYRWRPATPVQGAPPGKANDWIALGAGLVLYAAFLFGLHRWFFGISPLGGT
jgi:uncharacterized membrane protein